MEDEVNPSTNPGASCPVFPPSRILYESLYGDRWFDSLEEFNAWKVEPLWRRLLLQTANDKKVSASRRPPARP